MAYRDDWPVLVVSPSSARHHWQAELLSVLYPDHIEPRDITIVESSSHPLYKGSQNFKSKILIISYHLISKLMEVLLQIPFNVIIVDESHYMKSATAQRTRCLIPLLHKSKRAILLSGTPALSRPIELFTQLHALAPEQWKDLKEYGRRYCVASKSEQRARLQALAAQQQQGGGFGAGFGASGAAMSKSWAEFNGASNTEELHLMLSATIMIRRLKKVCTHFLSF
jgi:SWI/SNF-related matrix-associated actin-dependent regulator 1 of chromatin subfamily A